MGREDNSIGSGIVNKRTRDDLELRFEAAGEWVELAIEHSEIASELAKKPRYRKHALYHAQQSMETAAKGIAIGAGVSHDEVRKHSHDYPYLFFLLMEKVITESNGIQYANELLAPYYAGQGGYNVEVALGNMLTLTSSPKKRGLSKAQKESAETFFDVLLQFPPEAVEMMLTRLAKLNQSTQKALAKEGPIAKFTKEPFVLEPSRSDGSFVQSVYKQLVEQSRERPGGRKLSKAETDLLRRLAGRVEANLDAEYTGDQIWEWLEEQGGKFSFDASQTSPALKSFFDMQSVLAGILIIGSLVWPHESYPRYPAPPDASDSLEEAAQRTRRGRSLGTRHYTEELGVIKHIKPLTAQSRNTARLLKKCYDHGFMLAVFPNDS